MPSLPLCQGWAGYLFQADATIWSVASNLRKEHVHCIGDERILGDSDFVREVLKRDSLNLNETTLRSSQSWTFDKLIQHVCALCGTWKALLLRKAREKSRLRAKPLICFWGTTELGLTTI